LGVYVILGVIEGTGKGSLMKFNKIGREGRGREKRRGRI
jgi:hypothetical protein